MTDESDAKGDLPIQRIVVGEGGERREIATRVRSGRGAPVVWLGGFRSDMRATKVMALDAWAAERDRPLIRFDYTGHGESGGRFEDATISTWLEDAQTVIAAAVQDPPVLVGSSMGGWIACLVARSRLLREAPPPAGMVLIAPAVDFTEDLMWQTFPPDVRRELETTGVWYRSTPYAPDPDPISLRLIEDGRRHRLLTDAMPTGCPVHILQGMADPDVPYAHALKVLDRLPAEGARLTLIKDGDHRLSRPQDIALLLRSVEAIAD